MAYTPRMRFIETPIFTRAIVELLDDEVIPTLTVRSPPTARAWAGDPRQWRPAQVRWPQPGQGKRGGLRVIYFWDDASETFYMLYVFPKNEQEDLTAQQLRVLSRLVREEFG